MDDLTIFDDTRQDIFAEDEILFRRNEDGSIDKIGYKWLIDEETSRYQYVLEPGDYSFSAKSADLSINKSDTRRIQAEPELLVKHFVAGEVISSVDYSGRIAAQDFDTFTIMVTLEPENVRFVTDSIDEQLNNTDINTTDEQLRNASADINDEQLSIINTDNIDGQLNNTDIDDIDE